MKTVSQGVVLHSIKYKESSLISRIYTEQYGLISCIAKGVRSKNKKSIKRAYFQPLSVVELEVFYKPNNEIHAINDIKPEFIFKTIHTDFFKLSVSFFISEILLLVLKDFKDKQLYNFILQTISYLDEREFSNLFYLVFMAKLTRFLGIKPLFNSVNVKFPVKLDIQKATFLNQVCDQNKEDSALLQIFYSDYDSMEKLTFSKQQRDRALWSLLDYYQFHLEIKTPKSLKVLREIFSS